MPEPELVSLFAFAVRGSLRFKDLFTYCSVQKQTYDGEEAQKLGFWRWCIENLIVSLTPLLASIT